MPTPPKHDNFLVDAVKPKPRPPRPGGLTYADGFRFGFGFFIAALVVSILLGGISWAAVALLHLN